jgi:hypothetical protein
MTDLEITRLCAKSIKLAVVLYTPLWEPAHAFYVIPDKAGRVLDAYGELCGEIYAPLLDGADCFELIDKNFVCVNKGIDEWHTEAYIELDPFPNVIRARHNAGDIKRAVCVCVANLWKDYETLLETRR